MIKQEGIAQVRVGALEVTNYKGYSHEAFAFEPGLNLVTGANGSGKTNLIDAIHYICVARSFISSQDRYNVRDGEAFFRLVAQVYIDGKEQEVVVKVSPGKIKTIEVDNRPLERLSTHVGTFPLIILSPKDQMLIMGPRNERRRFLDFYLSQVSGEYLEALVDYNRLLQQRNAHLKQHLRHSDQALLKTYLEKMHPLLEILTNRRAAFVSTIADLVKRWSARLSESRDDVSIAYKPDCTADDFIEKALANLEKDMILGRTSVGAHRDDIHFEIDESALKKYGSQGQMKTYLIALHLALHAYIARFSGKFPIILLDDIFDKLDDDRTLNLVRLLTSENFGQVFITDARSERVEKIRHLLAHPVHVIHIKDHTNTTSRQ